MISITMKGNLFSDGRKDIQRLPCGGSWNF